MQLPAGIAFSYSSNGRCGPVESSRKCSIPEQDDPDRLGEIERRRGPPDDVLRVTEIALKEYGLLAVRPVLRSQQLPRVSHYQRVVVDIHGPAAGRHRPRRQV